MQQGTDDEGISDTGRWPAGLFDAYIEQCNSSDVSDWPPYYYALYFPVEDGWGWLRIYGHNVPLVGHSDVEYMWRDGRLRRVVMAHPHGDESAVYGDSQERR